MNLKNLKNLIPYLLISVLLRIAGPALFAGSYPDTNRLTILFAGDIMGHDSQINAAFYTESGTYDYNFCYAYLKPFIQKADIAVGNLEVTLSGEPYKGYPRFSSPDELAKALKETGFDILVNANNHALDRGKEGLERTIQVIRNGGLIMTGTFESGEARKTRYPLIVEKNNILLAILNYTYGTNELIPSPPNIVNYIDTSMIRDDIRKVRKVNPDFIIACMHWGNEYERFENEAQQALAQFLANEGVDAIIGSHPHVIQPVKFLYNRTDSADFVPIVYSLGNFISNQRERYRNGGIIFSLDLAKTDKTIITDYSYLPVWVQKPVIQDKTRFRMIPANISDEEAELLELNKEEVEKLEEFYNDTRTHLSNIKESRLIIKDLSWKHLLPHQNQQVSSRSIHKQ
jgi:poly-gamma-glutamate capsule biosynthesis protein CapA/YwtB (metallophosphatase superfamily)